MKKILFTPPSRFVFNRNFSSLKNLTPSSFKNSFVRGGGSSHASHGKTEDHHNENSLQNPNDIYVDDIFRKLGRQFLSPIWNKFPDADTIDTNWKKYVSTHAVKLWQFTIKYDDMLHEKLFGKENLEGREAWSPKDPSGNFFNWRNWSRSELHATPYSQFNYKVGAGLGIIFWIYVWLWFFRELPVIVGLKKHGEEH